MSVAAGTASCAVGTLSAGTHTLEATYSGDANYLTDSISTADYEVGQAVSAVGVSSNAVSSSVPAPVWGQGVSFVATITADGALVTSGTVQWSIDGLPVGAPVPVGPDGTARLGPVTDLPVGSDRVTAAFSGTSQDAPASDELDVVVGKAATSTAVTVTAAALTATVVAAPPGAGTPTGTVTFEVNGAVAGSAPVSPSGTATLANPSSGAESLSVAYGGDADIPRVVGLEHHRQPDDHRQDHQRASEDAVWLVPLSGHGRLCLRRRIRSARRPVPRSGDGQP